MTMRRHGGFPLRLTKETLPAELREFLERKFAEHRSLGRRAKAKRAGADSR